MCVNRSVYNAVNISAKLFQNCGMFFEYIPKFCSVSIRRRAILKSYSVFQIGLPLVSSSILHIPSPVPVENGSKGTVCQ